LAGAAAPRRVEDVPRYTRRVAPGVVETHATRCARSDGGRRCTCEATYVAEARSHGKRLAKAFATLDEALGWLIDVRAARLHGRLPELVRRSAPSLESHAKDFLRRARAGKTLNRSGKAYAPATIESYETALRLRALDVVEPRTGIRLGDLRVDAIDARALQSAVDELAAAAGAARARTAAAGLSAVLADAYGRGLRDELPPRLRLPPPPSRRKRLVDDELLERLLAAAGADDVRRKRSFAVPLVTLLDATGCRISEILAATWGPGGLDLDADPPALHVAAAKTAAGVRDVLLEPETVTVLRRHRLATGRPVDGRPVFADAGGKPLTRSGRVRATLARLAKEAKVEKLGPHMFRHGHATALARGDVPAAIAANRLGHADGGALFLRTYQHVDATDQRAALDALRMARAARLQAVRRAGDEQSS
jgi:integrase